MAHSSLRFGIGRFTTEAEIDFVVEKIVGTVKKLRDMRYDHFQERADYSLTHILFKPVVGDGPRGH
jgi:cysteine desulfurase